MRRLMTISLCMILLLTLAATGLASGIVPYADTHFDSLTINLTSFKYVAYQATAKEEYGVIKVTSSKLQQKVGSKWTNVCDLDVPDVEENNSKIYDEVMDYSDVIGAGTFRISATFYADGHTATRTSNERTFTN